jgi:hypothetical protein
LITGLELLPPLAYGRLGASATPCPNFEVGPSDVHPRGTGKTIIRPAETLSVGADGTVTASTPAAVAFKDAAGWRPVCPFFELHGTWELGGQRHSGPITPAVLADNGVQLSDVRWRVDVANLKAHHYTLAAGDRVAASAELAGTDTTRRPLRGVSPSGAARPLVPPGRNLPLGSVQLTRPTAGLPELRLRFTPGGGFVYGPVDLPDRGSRFVLPAERLILNPDSAWGRFVVTGDDPRVAPAALFAGADNAGQSLGLVDDTCDGVVRCSIPGVAPALARIVVGPPDFAPDRRPVVSAADGLTDRVRRGDVRDPAYVADEALTTLEIRDLMERVLETMENMNLDAENFRLDGEFPSLEPLPGRPLPLTEFGRQKHRRFVALEVFEDILREQPDLIDRVIREPLAASPNFDRRMPTLMRGADGRPMHLTRRQYDLLRAWAARLRRGIGTST